METARPRAVGGDAGRGRPGSSPLEKKRGGVMETARPRAVGEMRGEVAPAPARWKRNGAGSWRRPDLGPLDEMRPVGRCGARSPRLQPVGGDAGRGRPGSSPLGRCGAGSPRLQPVGEMRGGVMETARPRAVGGDAARGEDAGRGRPGSSPCLRLSDGELCLVGCPCAVAFPC